MASWQEILDEIQVLMGTSRVTAIDDDDILKWFNIAQRNFAIRHTAPERVTTYNGDGSATEFDLPSDFLEVYAVYWDDEGMFLEPRDYKPGIIWDMDSADETTRPYGFIKWPADKLTLFHAPEAGTGNVTLYYWGLYSDVSGPTDTLEPPVWSHEALILYTIALSLVPDLQNTAAIRQWNQRVDSGRPVDNPLLQSFDKIMQAYHETLSLWPKQNRAIYYYSGGRNV